MVFALLIVLRRLSKHVGHDEKKHISESFIMSNMSHYPVMWHFCSRVQVIEYKVEQFLHFFLNDFDKLLS